MAAERYDEVFRFLQSFGIIVITLYIVYFCMILSKTMIVIKNLKKTYRYSLALTLVSMSLSLTLMYYNG